MPDYHQGTGNSGTLMIRDTGGNVEFWMHTSSASTWFGSGYTFHWTSPHGSGSWQAQYPAGSGWRHMGTIHVSVNGNVSWTIPKLPAAFGGPTTQTVYISRSSAPGQVTGLSVSPGHTNATLTWSRGAINGGAFEFDQVQIANTPQSGLGDFTSGVVVLASVDGTRYTSDVTSLEPGTRYWAHVRTRTNVGWGTWSNIFVFDTIAGGYIKVNGSWRRAVVYVKSGGVWRATIPYIKVNGSWRACG